MKIFFLTLILLFSNSVNSNWILYYKSSSGDEYCYNSNIKTFGDLKYIWFREKFTKVEHEVRSIQSYIKIDCVEFSYQSLSRTLFRDQNWTDKIVYNNEPYDKYYIKLNTEIEILANIICEKL